MPLNKEEIISFIKIMSEFLRNNADTILNISILLSCILLYVNIPKVISLILKDKSDNEERIERWKKNYKKFFWFFFLFLLSFFCYDYLYPEMNTDILKSTSYFSRRTLKFCLAMILNISNFYINYKSYGFKSWRSYLSIISMISTIFIAGLFYSDKFSSYVKFIFLKTVELVAFLWLLVLFVLEHKPYLGMKLGGPIIKSDNVIKEVKDQFGPLKVIDYDSEEELYRNYKRKKSPYKKDIGEGDEKPFRRKQLSWYPPTKSYEGNNPRSPYHPYHLLYRHTDYEGLWRDRYKYIKGPLAHIKYSETYYDIYEKKFLPHIEKNSAQFAEDTPEPIIRKKHIDYKPTHPAWQQNTPNYKQWYKTRWGDKYHRTIPKDIVDDTYLRENEKLKDKRKVFLKKTSRSKVIFLRNKGTLIYNHPLNRWHKYTKIKIKNDLYFKIQPTGKYIKNIEDKKISYQWERSTRYIKRRNGLNTYFEYKNQNLNQNINKNQYKNEHEKVKKQSKEIVYLDRMEIESNFKSVYVDVDVNTGRVFIKEIPVDEDKRKFELNNRKYNIERLVKFKKINGNICRLKVNYQDRPIPWYKDKKALWLNKFFRTGYEGQGRPEYIDLPLSQDGTLTIFDPDLFKYKTRQEKIEAGIKMKEALTENNSIHSLKSIIDANLKNDENTPKQIKKNLKKNKPVLMVEDRHLRNKQNTKDKIKSFLKRHMVGLFKGKSNIIKEIIDSKEQKEKISDLTGKQKEKFNVELGKKGLEELIQKKDYQFKINEEERMTPPLLRESELESESESDSASESDSDSYQVYWDDKPINLKKKKKNLSLLSLFTNKDKNNLILEDKSINKSLFDEQGKNKPLPPLPTFEKRDSNKSLPPLPFLPLEEEILKNQKSILGLINLTSEKVPLSINKLIKEDIKVIRWMNDLPLIEDDNKEEIKDEDLPVQPYKSKNKKITKIEEYVNENEKENLEIINRIDEGIKEDIIQVGESVKKDVIEIEKLIDENLAQEDKFKDKEAEIKKEKKKERGLNFDLFNKEYDEMFPPKRPEDYNWQQSWASRLTQAEKEEEFRKYYEINASKLLRSNYNPIYPDPVDDTNISSGSGVIISSNVPIISEENELGNNSNEVPLWEKRHNHKWNLIIRQFYFENRDLYKPTPQPSSKYYAGLHTPDWMFEIVRDSNAEMKKRKDVELASLYKEAEKEREAIKKQRAEFMRHGINPDKYDYWRNDLVIENICSVIMDKVRNGIDYKVDLLEDEEKFLRHNTINRYEIASAWERVFYGGKIEDKLGDDYYKEVARLETIKEERIMLLDLKTRVQKYKLEIFRHQLLREIKNPTQKAADSMEDSRIDWIEGLIKDQKKQTEVYNHALDYIKRVNNNENARWCRTAAPLHIEWAEYYLNRQKPGTLNFNLFDPENPDKFTIDMIDRFLKQDYDLLELDLKKEQENIERERWRRENSTEVRKEYEKLLRETQEEYSAFKEEQRRLDEEDRLSKERAWKRREEREKKGDDDDTYF